VATRLRKLKITRVACVDQGANPDADILLWKRQDPDSLDKQDAPADALPDPTPVTPSSMPPIGRPASPRVRRRRRRTKAPIGKYDEPMGLHPEPDGDETPPLSYAQRGQQYDLWECLWDAWECFCETVRDVFGDSDADNLPYLPILVESIGQFQADVADLIAPLGLTAKLAPALARLTDVAQEDVTKVGAPMADHRRKRLQDAIAALQQILDECTPETIEHPGLSAADVRGMPGIMKGAKVAILAETQESIVTRAERAEAQLVEVTKRAQTAEMERDQALANVSDLSSTIVTLRNELDVERAALAKARQTPEEAEAAYWASVPDVVRKRYEADQL